MAEYKIDIEKSAQNILDCVRQKLGISAEQLMDLVQAYQDGRCVVLPCKPGDTVWYLTGNPSMTNRLCFDRVDSARVVGFYFDERGMQVRLDYFHGSHGTYGFYGKTVFSTREAAEAALAKEARP